LTQSATEYPLTSTDSKGEITHHVIDRTFIDEQGVRWIIDYKTSVFEGGGEEKLSETDFIQQQVKAYQSQLQRYGELFSQMETRSQQRVLYFSDLDRWEVL
jgi:ATP-dependent exoDNAse (exonuclease V) beta subunit